MNITSKLLCTLFAMYAASASSYEIRDSSASEGSIYKTDSSIDLYSDERAHKIGDMVTIVLSERTNASKSASTKTKKDNSLNMENPTIMGAPFAATFPSVVPIVGGKGITLENIGDTQRAFDSKGDSSQSNALVGNITAFVIDKYPNGYLKIKGEKNISINQGDETIRVEGVIRSKDIRANNSVLSTSIADAKISYGGAGIVQDSNRMGWMSRFFNSKWWPF